MVSFYILFVICKFICKIIFYDQYTSSMSYSIVIQRHSVIIHLCGMYDKNTRVFKSFFQYKK